MIILGFFPCMVKNIFVWRGACEARLNPLGEIEMNINTNISARGAGCWARLEQGPDWG